MKVEILYPEVANLYGDCYNIEYLQRSVPHAQVVRTDLKTRPAFLSGSVDLVYMGTMTEHAQQLVVQAMKEYREELSSSIEKGQNFLFTGNSLEILGRGIQDVEGEKTEGLGIFRFHTTRDMLHRYNSLYLGKYGDLPVVGYKSQFTQSWYDEPCEPLFVSERGPGFHPGIAAEGIRYRNLRATYVLGPLFVLNPKLMVQMLAEMGCGDVRPAFYEEAIQAYEERLAEYRDPRRGFSYE